MDSGLARKGARPGMTAESLTLFDRNARYVSRASNEV